jgi:hypothetical protein
MATKPKMEAPARQSAAPCKTGQSADLHDEALQREEAKRGADRHDILVALLREKAREMLEDLTPDQALRCYLQAFALRFKKEIKAGSLETIMQEELDLFRKKASGDLDLEP